MTRVTANTVRSHRQVWLFAGGLLSVFAWHGGWDIALAAWVYPVFLLRFAQGSKVRVGFLSIWGVQAVSGVVFLYQSGLLVRLPVVASVPGIVAGAALLTVPFTLDRVLAPRLGGGAGLLATMVFPAARVAVEFLLGQVGPYGAFVVLGTTQHGDLPLIQVASVAGVYGVSFLVAWLAPVVNLIWQRGLPARPAAGRPWLRVAVGYVLVLAAVFAAGATRLALFPPDGPKVRVAGISPSAEGATARSAATMQLRRRYGSFAQVLAQAPDDLRTALAGVNDDLIDHTAREAAAGSRIIAWSETAAWVRQEDEDALLQRVREIAVAQNVYVLVGLSVYTERAPMLHNQTVLVTPDGAPGWRYDKTHPTPMEGLRPGDGRVPTHTTRYGRLAGVICFDADFPALTRQAAGRADLMLVPSHDWAEIAAAHAQRAAFRAVEDGYPMLRPDGDGLSTVIDHQGRTLASTRTTGNGGQVVVAYLPIYAVRTVYGVVGDLFAWLCMLALAALALAGLLRPATPPPAPASETSASHQALQEQSSAQRG